MKHKGNTDYLKTDARTKDGWRAIRTFNSGTGEWRLTNLGKRWFADHDSNALCIAAFKSAHSASGAKNKSSRRSGSISSHKAGSHAQVMPPPRPRVSVADSGSVQRKPNVAVLEPEKFPWLRERAEARSTP